jgi:hypothetical protein
MDVFLLLLVNSARKKQNLLKADLHLMIRISRKKQNIHLFNTSPMIIFTDDDSSSARSLAAVKLSIQVDINWFLESVSVSWKYRSTKSNASRIGLM